MSAIDTAMHAIAAEIASLQLKSSARAAEIEKLRADMAEVVTALPQAVRRERERCANIAENYDLGTPDGHAIAAIIREQP